MAATPTAGVSMQELGAFLKQRRASMKLRREDVATTASVGFDWVVRIEQGRGRPSPEVLDRIAAALKLDHAEIEYMHALAGHRAARRPAPTEDDIPPSVLRVMHHQAPAPAYVLNGQMNVLAWNDSACEFYGVEFGELDEADRNVLFLMLTNTTFHERVADWRVHAERLVMQCRTMWAGRLASAEIRAVVDRMLDVSAEFRNWWAAPMTDVITLAPVRKVVLDRQFDEIIIEQTAWQFGDKSDHILILSTPIDKLSAGRREQLAERRKLNC